MFWILNHVIDAYAVIVAVSFIINLLTDLHIVDGNRKFFIKLFTVSETLVEPVTDIIDRNSPYPYVKSIHTSPILLFVALVLLQIALS